MKRVLGASLLTAFAACAELCPPSTPDPNPRVCVEASASIAAGRPFTLTGVDARSRGGGTATCTTSVDGGLLSFLLEGTDCRDPLGQDVAILARVSCEVPALAEGTYVVAGEAGSLTVFDGGFSFDAGSSSFGTATCF